MWRKRSFVVVLCSVLASVVTPPGEAAAPVRHAGVVIQHGDLGVLTDCVAFKKKSINGYELLKRSRFAIRAARYPDGVGICSIDGEGCNSTKPSECFCTPLVSWTYWTQESGAPVYDHGHSYANARVITDGDIDYWAFGPHGMAVREVFTIEDLCGGAHAHGASEPTSAQRAQMDALRAGLAADHRDERRARCVNGASSLPV